MTEFNQFPVWEDLPDADKGTAVFWIRTVIGEGLDYALENYSVAFRGDDSDDVHRKVYRFYKADYDALTIPEFVRLYDIGEAKR